MHESKESKAKKFVKLLSPYKKLPGETMSNLQKENDELR